jgi:5-formyltetrahydrofolate cyclo-ligase
LLAFDGECWRLGYGGGYYDRTLDCLRRDGDAVAAVGIAFEGQRLDKIPTGPYDMRLDAVLCPDGLIVAT